MAALIAEDLLLLLLDDDKGTTASTWVDVRIPLGAAVLAELAVLGAVEPEAPERRWRASRIRAVDGVEVDDGVLAQALKIVAQKPRTAQDLANRIGTGLHGRLASRLVDRGVLERREGRLLGLFPRTTWPARSVEQETAVRAGLTAVLLQDAVPDGRQAVLVGILAALSRVPKTLGLHGAEGRRAAKRAKAVSEQEWAAKEVRRAVEAAVAATVAATGATTVIVTSS